MKGFALILLCALAVQARHTGVQTSTRAAAALGENPWLVHLRIAVSTSGLLNTCTGTLIGSQWILTAASCVRNVRFVWSRFGAVNVINPSLVIESSTDPHVNGDLALININRQVLSYDNIAYVKGLANTKTETPSSAKYCGYGGSENPGEQLNCFQVGVKRQDDGVLVISSDDVDASRFDVGAPLINSDGTQVGVLIAAADENSDGKFAPVANYLEWIEAETGLDFTPADAPEVPPESIF